MKWVVLTLVLGLAAAAVGVAIVFGYARATRLSALGQPGAVEAWVARSVRSLSIPGDEKARSSPFPRSSDTVDAGMAHFADHCASCHANDGSGRTEMGQKLWPKAPDMRTATTQSLTDGELFHIIEHGIRFTGMPGWRTGDAAGEESTWHLVHFIRELPRITPQQLAQMERLNPRSPEDIRQELEEEAFLSGGDAPAAAPDAPAAPHAGH